MSKRQISSQVMELKDLISGPLVATIDADTISTRRYLSYLFELAFDSYDPQTGQVGDLRYLEFSYQSVDANGKHTQSIRIPILTLVPLPLLQIKEANFDFDIQIIDAVMADHNATFSLKNKNYKGEESSEQNDGLKLRVTMAAANGTAREKSVTNRSLTANMKVNVKMQQADMPGGLMKLLNLTTNNVQIEDNGTENPVND